MNTNRTEVGATKYVANDRERGDCGHLHRTAHEANRCAEALDAADRPVDGYPRTDAAGKYTYRVVIAVRGDKRWIVMD